MTRPNLRVGKAVKVLGVLVKVLEIAISCTMLGFYSNVFPWLYEYGNRHQMALVYLTAGSFIIITSITYIGQLFGEVTPKCLIISFCIVATAMFSAVGAVCIHCWENAGETQSLMRRYGTLKYGQLLSVGVLAVINGFIYFVDAIVTGVWG